MQKFAVVGGDSRQAYLVDLLERDGFRAVLLMNGNAEDNILRHLKDSDTIILPLPTSRDGITLYAPLYKETVHLTDIAPLCKDKTVLMGGSKAAESILKSAGANAIDYFAREELIIMNALATAEGAINLVMTNTPFTIHGSRCLVIGYGRIGKILSKTLYNMGAVVSASARKAKDIAWINVDGIDSIETDSIWQSIHEYDVIFNTVPARVLGERELTCCKKDTLIIELASEPGGIDTNIADKLGIRIIKAAGLPGKIAPLSSANYIKETILNILLEG